MNLQVAAEDGGAMHLKQAILLYGSHSDVGYATVHDVIRGVHDRPEIMPGALLNREALEGALLGMMQAHGIQTWNMVSENVLASGPSMVAWWTPERAVHMHFRSDDPTKSGMAMQPAMVWIATPGDLRLFTLQRSERPTEATELMQPVHYNVWSDRRLCLGNSRVPQDLVPAKWEAMFYESMFTHPNNGEKWQCSFKGGVKKLWQKLLREAGKKRFPADCLIPTGLTLLKAIQAAGDGK